MPPYAQPMQLHAGRMNDADSRGFPHDAPISAAEWLDYLRSRGLLDSDSDPAVVPLTGGVSAQVVRVGGLVCKQPYRRLKVETAWIADMDRAAVEARALSQFEHIAPPLVHFDPDTHVLVQGFVEGQAWKAQLLSGQVDPAVAAELGTALTAIHSAPTDEFTDGGRRLRQLRLDPYLVHAARTAPEFAGVLADVDAQLSAPGRSVVHGDFSPKNILVSPTAVTVIDWEVAHIGAPEFDLAFLVCHLRAKAAHLPHWEPRFAAAEAAFLAHYRLPYDQRWYRRLLAALLIARIHGRSPLSYLSPISAAALLDQARELLAAD